MSLSSACYHLFISAIVFFTVPVFCCINLYCWYSNISAAVYLLVMQSSIVYPYSASSTRYENTHTHNLSVYDSWWVGVKASKGQPNHPSWISGDRRWQKCNYFICVYVCLCVWRGRGKYVCRTIPPYLSNPVILQSFYTQIISHSPVMKSHTLVIVYSPAPDYFPSTSSSISV